MPENYYCYDNFFYKVTNMESPRKNNDCYFFYYSTCRKGDSCTFRHEPSALGCETVCSFWKEGKCLNVHCSFRHMELRKNRKAIPCYWEAQPGGCLKPHCPFLHKSPKDSPSDSLESTDLQASELSKALGQSSSKGSDSDRKMSQYSETNFGNPTVDPLVVNFEEESDNESAPTNSPTKPNQTRVVKVKTLEEIRLEKIQAESAAYYFYPGAEEVVAMDDTTELESADDLRQRILKRLNIQSEDNDKDFEVMSLDEIRRKRKKLYVDCGFNCGSDEDLKLNCKRMKITLNKKGTKDITDIKIKTLSEIRAERLLKSTNPDIEQTKIKLVDDTCSEVSSTSNSEELRDFRNEEAISKEKLENRQADSQISGMEDSITKKPKLIKLKLNRSVVESTVLEKTSSEIENVDRDSINISKMGESDTLKQNNFESKNSIKINEEQLNISRDSSKLDDILLLDDEDMEDASINLKAEEDILKDIDDLLNN